MSIVATYWCKLVFLFSIWVEESVCAESKNISALFCTDLESQKVPEVQAYPS